LIESKANVNIRDQLGKVPLYWAAAEGNLKVVKTLIAGGAKKDFLIARDKEVLDKLLASEPVSQAESNQVDALQESVEHATEATTTDEIISVMGDVTLDA